MSTTHKTEAGVILAKIKTALEGIFVHNKTAANLVTGFTHFLLGAQKAFNSNVAISIAALIPKGIGNVILADIQKLIQKALPDAEIVGRCTSEIEAATAGLTDPAAIIDATLPIVIKEIQTLPANQQGKHIEEIIVVCLTQVLDLPLSEIELLVKNEVAQIQAAEAAAVPVK